MSCTEWHTDTLEVSSHKRGVMQANRSVKPLSFVMAVLVTLLFFSSPDRPVAGQATATPEQTASAQVVITSENAQQLKRLFSMAEDGNPRNILSPDWSYLL